MKKYFQIIIMALIYFVSGCSEPYYDVYNDFTGPVQCVELRSTASVVYSQTEQLYATVYPSMTSNKKVSWESDDPGIVSVDQNGVITGNVVDQSAVVRVITDDGGFTAECTVTVVPVPIPVVTWTVASMAVVGTGTQVQLTRNFTPADATSTEMSWKSSNSSVATVDSAGLVTGVKDGSAVITVTSVRWGLSASCNVSVGAPSFTVTYDANEGSGTVPTDSNLYGISDSVTVLGPGSLTKENCSFAGWCINSGGTGTVYSPGWTFTMGGESIVLYAKWTSNPTYKVIFDKNDSGATGAMGPQMIISSSSAALTANAFTKSGWDFAGWALTRTGGVAYLDGQSYEMGSSDITLYAKWTPPSVYAVGNRGPAGGWIIYDKGIYLEGWRYLEAAPADIAGGYIWGTAGNVIAGISFNIGMGESNSFLIKNGDSLSNKAADVCLTYVVENCGVYYGDWFLPSLYELRCLIDYSLNIGLVADSQYWTSTQESSSAYALTTGSIGNALNTNAVPKNNTFRVRPVRTF